MNAREILTEKGQYIKDISIDSDGNITKGGNYVHGIFNPLLLNENELKTVIFQDTTYAEDFEIIDYCIIHKKYKPSFQFLNNGDNSTSAILKYLYSESKKALEFLKRESYIWNKNIKFDETNDYGYEKLELNKSNNTIEYISNNFRFNVIISLDDLSFTINEHFEEEYFGTEYNKTFDSMKLSALNEYNSRLKTIEDLENKINSIINELKAL